MATPAAIILAAGRGTRMKSKIPKVLHRLAGKPMVRYALEAVREAGLAPVVLVVGHGADAVTKEVGDHAVCAEQTEQLGTGHAVLQGLPHVGDAAEVVVLYGDSPLVQAQTLRRLVEARRAARAPIALLTAVVDDPSAYGRIVRDGEGRVVGIVEVAGAPPEVLQTKEINGGLYCFDTSWLRAHLSGLPLHPKGEYYLTDLPAVASAEGLAVEGVPGDAVEIAGVNDRVQLAEAEQVIRSRIRRELMLAGVTLVDPATAYVDADAQVGADTVIWPNTIVAGNSVIGERCEIGPNSHIVDSKVGDGCRIWASVIESSVLETGVTVGPFSHLRPGSRLEAGVHVGNFAEIKNSHVDSGTKIHHFSYVGDATVGRNVNVGAGTITCNYDSETRQKHRTVVEDGAALGSDTMLVAPVWIGKGAMTGAGSVVTKDVPPDSLAVGVPARVVRKVKKST